MSLIQVLKNLGLTQQTAQNAREALLVLDPATADTTLKKWRDVSGWAVYAGVSLSVTDKFVTNNTDIEGGPTFYAVVNGPDGYDFGSPTSRGQLLSIIEANKAEHPWIETLFAPILVACAAKPKWASEGLAEEPTLEQVSDALTAISNRDREHDKLTNAWTIVSNAFAAGVISTKAEADVLFAETE